MAASGVRSSWLASAAKRAQPGLAGLAPGERGLHVAEHPVEGGADLADLGPRVGVRHPLGQADLAAGQRQLGHPGRGGRDPPQRPQRHAHPGRADHAGEQQRGREHGDLGQRDLAQRGR